MSRVFASVHDRVFREEIQVGNDLLLKSGKKVRLVQRMVDSEFRKSQISREDDK